MNIMFYTDLGTFRQRAAPLLKRHCAVNSLKLGILEYYSDHEPPSDQQVFAIGVEHGDVIAVFIQTKSLYFVAHEAYVDEVIPCAIEEILNRQISIPSVMGYGETALRFAECWKQRTQAEVIHDGKDYLYELTSIDGFPSTRGTLKLAVSDDIPQLKPLFRDYYREDLGRTTTDDALEQDVARQLAEDEVYFWDDDGVKSIVTAILPSDAGVELANVFTLPRFRHMGYAAACLSEVCRMLLHRYPRIVLFVDQGNTVAQALYMKIGFHHIAEMNTYRFSET